MGENGTLRTKLMTLIGMVEGVNLQLQAMLDDSRRGRKKLEGQGEPTVPAHEAEPRSPKAELASLKTEVSLLHAHSEYFAEKIGVLELAVAVLQAEREGKV